MGSFFCVVLHRIPSLVPGPDPVDRSERDIYRAIIDRASPESLVEAMVGRNIFDVAPFGVDHDDFHDGHDDAVAILKETPLAVAAARELLYEVVDSHVIGHCPDRADVLIGGGWVAIYGGRSWGDLPFDGYDGVCALAMLPELSVPAAAGVPATLQSEVFGAITDGMDPAVMEWVSENPYVTDSLVADEIGKWESVITDRTESVLSVIRADIRDEVVRRIESTLEAAPSIQSQVTS